MQGMNLIVLYCVDPETNAYREHSASTEYEGLGIPGQGDDFFEAVFEDSLRKIHPEDRSLFHSQITKENILAAIEQSGEFAKDAAGKVTMRFGVYANAQEEPDIEERFIRAQIAADSIGNDPQKICGYYEF